MRRLLLLILALLLGAPGAPLLMSGPALAVEPSEMLADPVLEARARKISKGLRCLVCQNENIDESNAGLAHDLRVLLRQRLQVGDTNAQAVAYIVARYGEFVLLRPTTRGANLILWIAGPLMLVFGLAMALIYIRRRRVDREAPPLRLSVAEDKRLKEILEE